jgi:hypothetical protein
LLSGLVIGAGAAGGLVRPTTAHRLATRLPSVRWLRYLAQSLAARRKVLSKWRDPRRAAHSPPAPAANCGWFEGRHTGRLMYLRTEPDSREKILRCSPRCRS